MTVTTLTDGNEFGFLDDLVREVKSDVSTEETCRASSVVGVTMTALSGVERTEGGCGRASQMMFKVRVRRGER